MKKIHLFLFLILTLSLSACTTTGWIVGGLIGAGAATYYVKHDERTAGQITDDFGVSASITAKFAESKDFSIFNIRANTYKGTVTLYGNVPNEKLERQAMLLAADVEGVKKVVSKMQIKAD